MREHFRPLSKRRLGHSLRFCTFRNLGIRPIDRGRRLLCGIASSQ